MCRACRARLFPGLFPFLGKRRDCCLRSVFFFFSSRRRHTRFDCDWSSDVCSSDLPERSTFAGLARAFLQLPGAIVSRWRARSLAVIDDTEAFRRPLAGYFRDRFATLPAVPDPLRVLFVSPYPICPPVHGGAVFMYQTCRELSTLVDLHLIVLLDSPTERYAHDELVAR